MWNESFFSAPQLKRDPLGAPRAFVKSTLASSFLLALVATVPLTAQAGSSRWPDPDKAPQLQALNERRASNFPIPRCRDNTPILTHDSIGPIRAGQAVRDLLRQCPRLFFGWYWEEGIPNPGFAVWLGKALVIATMTDSTTNARVVVAQTSSRTVRTSNGIGPGTLLRNAETTWGKGALDEAECQLTVSFHSQPGLAWIVTIPSHWECGKAEGGANTNVLPRVTRLEVAKLYKRVGA